MKYSGISNFLETFIDFILTWLASTLPFDSRCAICICSQVNSVPERETAIRPY